MTTLTHADVSPPLPQENEAGVEGEISLIDFTLESGQVVDVVVRYRLDGRINRERSNVVLAIHALTGSHRTRDWWPAVVCERGALDPRQYAVLGANVLGGCNGTRVKVTSDSEPIGVTTRDQAHVLARLLDELGIARPRLVVGGSLGGMIALEFVASYPERVEHVVSLAAPAQQTAQGFAWNDVMRESISLAGPQQGLALARRVAMISYRTPEQLEARFGARRAGTEPQVQRWLAHHGERLVERFDAASYLALINAMDGHDVGRGRGGVGAALRPIGDRLTGVGIPGDLLYPSQAVQQWCFAAGARYRVISSAQGHDAFLLESEQVNRILADVLSY